jgi:hypothetical protein
MKMRGGGKLLAAGPYPGIELTQRFLHSRDMFPRDGCRFAHFGDIAGGNYVKDRLGVHHPLAPFQNGLDDVLSKELAPKDLGPLPGFSSAFFRRAFLCGFACWHCFLLPRRADGFEEELAQKMSSANAACAGA